MTLFHNIGLIILVWINSTMLSWFDYFYRKQYYHTKLFDYLNWNSWLIYKLLFVSKTVLFIGRRQYSNLGYDQRNLIAT